MKRIITVLCIVAVVVCALPIASAKPSYTKDFEWEVLSLTNAERVKANLMPLSTFESLQKATTVRATETIQLFSHTRPDGRSCFTAIGDAGIKYYCAAENIAGGQRSPETVVTAWMDSPGHRANIMSSGHRHLGVGYVEGDTIYGTHWAQLFVGGCVTTAIAIEGDALRVSCDLHPDSYIPLENVQTEYLPNGTMKVTYDGFTATAKVIVPDGAGDNYFVDVPENAWYKDEVDYVVENGIFKGKSKYIFEPNTEITRAEFVQVLANLEKVDTSDRNVTTAFTDVPSGKWFTPAVKWASENEIVKGVGKGRFDPNAVVTREQMCVMLVNYAKFKSITLENATGESAFADDAKINSWSRAEVYACQRAKIVNGKEANTFDPQGTGIRAEAAAIFQRFHKTYLAK